MVKRLAAASAILACALLAGAAPASAQTHEPPSGVYKMDPAHASMFWRVKHLGLSWYTARMTGFSIDLTLDAQDLSKSVVTADIDPKSVLTSHPGPEKFDEQIATDPRFLDAPDFPQITFRSTSVKQTGEKTAEVTGDLTLRGVTHPVTLQVELVGALAKHPVTQKAAVGFHAEATLDRTQWGMDFLAPLFVGAEVTVTIDAEFLAE